MSQNSCVIWKNCVIIRIYFYLFVTYLGIRRWTLKNSNFFLAWPIRLKLSANFIHDNRNCYRWKFWLSTPRWLVKNSWWANQLIDHGNIIYGLHRHQNDGHDPLNSSPAMMSHADDVMNKLWRHLWVFVYSKIS